MRVPGSRFNSCSLYQNLASRIQKSKVFFRLRYVSRGEIVVADGANTRVPHPPSPRLWRTSLASRNLLRRGYLMQRRQALREPVDILGSRLTPTAYRPFGTARQVRRCHDIIQL